MKKRTKLLIGSSLSFASAFGVYKVIDNLNNGLLEKADKLEICAVKGLDADGCKDLVIKAVTPEIINNPLGYTAIYTPEAMIAESEALTESAVFDGYGLFSIGFTAFSGLAVTAAFMHGPRTKPEAH